MARPPPGAAGDPAVALSGRREALIRRLLRRRTRKREGLFVVEGIRGARVALERGGDVRFAVCSPRLRALEGGDTLAALLDEGGVDTTWTDDQVLEALSDTETPQGVLVVCREPAWTLEDVLGHADRGLLALDGVQDPGNVGTLIRSAAAFGVAGVLALDGTADPWSPKAVRGAAGTLFSTRVVCVPWKETASRLEAAGVAVVASGAGGRDVASWRPPERWMLVVGNEGRGVRPAVVRAARAVVGVPMAEGAESLNAGMAGAILLYVLTRRPT